VSYAANELLYLNLIRELLCAKLDGETFCGAFMRQWKADRDEQIAKSESWPERYDLQLIEAYQRGALTAEEFHRKWAELWGYTEYDSLCEMLDRVFTVCDCFAPAPEGPCEVSEDQLKQEVSEILRCYEERKAKPYP
jgi:hypothetical protein